MPFYDGTGPIGQGFMAGRGGGRRHGGTGRACRWRHQFNANAGLCGRRRMAGAAAAANEGGLAALKEQASFLQNALNRLSTRIEELEANAKPE